jgi:hypothetical protein
MLEWKKQPGENSHSSVITRLLRKPGDEGWELIGVAEDEILFFKRPKS